jgi:hypothetical protein
MKKSSFILLIVAISMASCVMSQRKNPDKENIPSLEPPKMLDDDWSKWLIGEWQGTAKSDFGEHKDWAKGDCRMKFELALNGQFLVRKGQSEVTDLSDEYIKQLKGQNLSDSDIEKIRNSSFESIEFYTVNPRTGKITGYLFDSLRCIAKGTGKRQGNKEIISWVWSVQGQGSSVRTTEKVSYDKFIATEKYTLSDGSIMEDKLEMTRIPD